MLLRSSCLSTAGALRSSSSESVPSWLASRRSKSVAGADGGLPICPRAVCSPVSRRLATGSSSRCGGGWERTAAGACCRASAAGRSCVAPRGCPGGGGRGPISSRSWAEFPPGPPGPGCPRGGPPCPPGGGGGRSSSSVNWPSPFLSSFLSEAGAWAISSAERIPSWLVSSASISGLGGPRKGGAWGGRPGNNGTGEGDAEACGVGVCASKGRFAAPTSATAKRALLRKEGVIGTEGEPGENG